jgi:enediyne biosynthesis protein E4
MQPKPSAVPRVFATVLFLGLLGLAFFFKRPPETASVSVMSDADALKRYGFKLTEVSKTIGVSFTHTAPRLDPKFEPILPRVADMGAGVAVADFDRDGWPDFYVTNSGEDSKNALFRNLGNGSFEDVAAKLGVAELNASGTGTSQGALWGDFDNDDFEDLLVYKWGQARLFKNNAGKGFTEVTQSANLPKINANAATLFDYDRDGKLDILLCGYFDEVHDMWNLKTTEVMPDELNFAKNGALKHLLHNEGNFVFKDTTESLGLTNRSWLLAAVAADLRGTGFPDLFLASDYGHAELWLNDGGKKFRNVGKESGVAAQPKSGMNVSIGDIFNDGRLSFYISNIWEDGEVTQGNNLWVPKTTNTKDKLEYENQAEALGLERGGWSFGAQFTDLDNDGFQDLYLTNGYISADKNKTYWYDYATLTGGNKGIISDIKNWPPMKGQSLSGNQPKKVWKSDGAGKFTEIAQAIGVTDRFDGRAVAVADLFNRGVSDVIVANQRGPLLVYKNEVAPGKHYLTIELDGDGSSNKSAIGAMVTVFWNGQRQTQVVTGGMGFCAQNDRRLHFGLGTSAAIEKVEIRWPAGKLSTVSAPKVDQLLKIKEST